ncbi:MAG: DeoR/GlpR family DNA-binding transcription regulator [Armatimonadetes bacterium]|nr:DeoR/GlpR family DNA-binding transcription regulator [Armatimonadota bacterium]
MPNTKSSIEEVVADDELLVGNTRQRRERILACLQEEEFVKTTGLSRLLRVSKVSVRKDLDFLEQQGLLKRVHGGAQLAASAESLLDLSARYMVNKTAKKQIAMEAVKMINVPGMTIYVDTGTTNLLLAQAISRDLAITVVTNSMSTISALEGRDACRVVTLGGVVDHKRKVFTGLWTDNLLDRFSFDLIFLGADSVTEDGYGCDDLPLGEVIRKAISRSKRSYVLADSSKVGRRCSSFYAGPAGITSWITDSRLDPEFKKKFESLGGSITIANAGESK